MKPGCLHASEPYNASCHVYHSRATIIRPYERLVISFISDVIIFRHDLYETVFFHSYCPVRLLYDAYVCSQLIINTAAHIPVYTYVMMLNLIKFIFCRFDLCKQVKSKCRKCVSCIFIASSNKFMTRSYTYMCPRRRFAR